MKFPSRVVVTLLASTTFQNTLSRRSSSSVCVALAFSSSFFTAGVARPGGSSFSFGSKKSSAIMASTTTANAVDAEQVTTCTSTSTSTTDNNPYLKQDDLPKFGEIKPSDLTPAIEQLLSQLQDDFNKLEQDLQDATSTTTTESTESTTTPDNTIVIQYDTVLPVMEQIQFATSYAWGVAGHLNGVQNSNALRVAYEENQPKIVKAFSQFSQSKPVYEALQLIQQQQQKVNAASTTSATDDNDNDNHDDFVLCQRRRAVENSLRDMKLGGVGLEGAEKQRFNDNKMRLAALSTTFSNNVLDETKAFSLTVTDPEKLQGVPESAKAMWAAAATATAEQKEDGEEQVAAAAADAANQGPWRITLDMPSYIAVMSHVKDRSIREQVYKAHITRASSNEKNNIPLIYEILKLKTEQAALLGFDNYAQLSISKKMASSVEAVVALTDLMGETALPAAERELQEIVALAASQDESIAADNNKLEPWDITFWSERLKESKFDLTEEETRPYFALPAVLEGMFSLVSRIFDITVEKADGETQVWHPDVSFFKVFDKSSGNHIASFYLDPYSRPEDKRGGAWMNVCIGKSEAVKRDIPVAYLTCNGSPPVGSKPSLMTFREVETLFHEFGHGLQHMLTTVKEGDVAGINGVEWDAVELPSQFMENWCYDRPTVYGFAKHWETGEPMPEDMFEKLKVQKTFNAGMMTCRQLLFGQVDLELYGGYDAESGENGTGESVFDVFRRVAAKYTPYNMPLPEDRFLCSFSHIFAGGYAAGYYSYKWAEVMSADAFSAFEEVGLDNEEEVKKVGMRFRDTVLSLGGGMDPMTVFKSFRGREPTPDALLRHNGLA